MKRIFAVVMVGLLLSSPLVTAQNNDFDERSVSQTYEDIFSDIFHSLRSTPGIVSFIDDIGKYDSTFTGINQGLALVTLMRLYDLYNDSALMDQAKTISDFIATNLRDFRYKHVATYYDADHEVISNYRASVDNFFTAWGLEMLAERIDPAQELVKDRAQDRAEFFADDLDSFIVNNRFVKEKRVDLESTSQNFDVYSNLMTSFVITESGSDLFSEFSDEVNIVYGLVKESIMSEEGGIYSLYFNGFHDKLITLRNTALFANLALNLFQTTGDQVYLDDALKSIEYINTDFYDIGITGGYIEAIEDGVPVQQAKSLFSHAILLLAMVKLVDAGQSEYRLDLMALWDTINRYFKRNSDQFYYSTITRNGGPASNTISIQDNLMLLLSLTFLPLLVVAQHFSEIEYRDKAEFQVALSIPENLESSLVVNYHTDDNQEHQSKTFVIKGKSGIQSLDFEITPFKPQSDTETIHYEIQLVTLNLTTDVITGQFDVFLESGIDLSFEVITLFSVIAIATFVLFINRVTNVMGLTREQVKTE